MSWSWFSFTEHAADLPGNPADLCEPAGRPMKGWVLVAPDGIEDDGRLDGWLQRAGTFVSGLPAK
jgi:hypothetical protein